MAETLLIVPSYGTQVRLLHAATLVRFGEGYEQRAPRGLNDKRMAARLVYAGVTSAKAAAVLAFFQPKGLTTAFLWTPPSPYNAAPFSDGSPVQWKATSEPVHTIERFDMETVEIEIEQDFNPLG